MKVYESDPTSVAAVGTETRSDRQAPRPHAAPPTRSRRKIERRRRRGQARHHAAARACSSSSASAARPTRCSRTRGAATSSPRPAARCSRSGLTSPSGTARISDEIVVKRNPDIIIAVPHGSPGNIPRLAGLLPQQPELAQHERGQNKRVYVATGNSLLQPYPGVASTIRDVRRKFLKNY